MRWLQRLGPSGRLLVAVAVGGVLFGIATAVQASIPDANGVIHGCYNTSLAHGSPTGALRVIDTARPDGNCASWEAPLNWNVRGVTGTTGPAGPTGPTGPTGHQNDGWFNAGNVDLPANGNDVTEASVTLPTGSFMLLGQVQVFVSGGAAAHCFLSSVLGTSTLTGAGDSVTLDFTAMPVNGKILVTTGPTTVNLVCFSAGAAGATTARGALTAVQVGTIH